MTYEELRRAVHTKPFHPFTLQMAGGRGIHVRSPEFVWLPPTQHRTFAVFDGEAIELIDLLLVGSARFRNGRARRPGRG